MSWRDKLQKASFRGVSFFTETADTTFGRRNILNEYPKKNVPFSEDMGRKAREYTIRAYVLEPDYFADRDALLKAIEDFDTPGTLVHPTLGSVKVIPKPSTLSYKRDEGGIEYFDLVFVEAGQNQYPSKLSNTGNAVKAEAANAKDVIQQVFQRNFKTDKLPDYFVSDSASLGQTIMSQTLSLGTSPLAIPGQLPNFVGTINQFKSGLSGLIYQPSLMSSKLLNAILMVGSLFGHSGHAYNALKPLAKFTDTRPAVPTTTPNRKQQSINRKALEGLTRQTAMIGMAQAAIGMQFASYNDAIFVRDEISTLIDDELLKLGETDDDDLFLTLQSLRQTVIADITARGGNLARIIQVSPSRVLPASVLAYSLYEDSERASEIIERNHVRHPGFCPAGPNALQILTS